MPRAREPARLIQTTLVHEGRSASFVWAEGVSRRALKELLRSGLLRDPQSITREPRGTAARAWSAHCIENPFNTKNAPIEDHDLGRLAPLFDSKQLVITRSPPTLISFKLLAHGASLVVVGMWLGTAFANAVGVPMLTFVSVPAGMMVVGAASGIAKGLETGLAQWLVERMTSARRTRQKPKPKSKPKKQVTHEERALLEMVRKQAGKGLGYWHADKQKWLLWEPDPLETTMEAAAKVANTEFADAPEKKWNDGKWVSSKDLMQPSDKHWPDKLASPVTDPKAWKSVEQAFWDPFKNKQEG